jgi:hypothetical protein
MENNRITLQYSVEEGNLKFEVHRLVCNAISRLESIACEQPPASSVLNMTTVDEIESLRTELAKVDILFSEAATIIENYIDYKHQQRMSSAVDNSQDIQNAASNLSDLDLNSLNEKIQNFKDNFSLHENAD